MFDQENNDFCEQTLPLGVQPRFGLIQAEKGVLTQPPIFEKQFNDQKRFRALRKIV